MTDAVLQVVLSAFVKFVEIATPYYQQREGVRSSIVKVRFSILLLSHCMPRGRRVEATTLWKSR